ncbi:MAG: hypothetical protein QM845_02705 [Verrucomicrobiota bacterium]|nr:hypothetical protein [Verrucomicrobiota bacterium]
MAISHQFRAHNKTLEHGGSFIGATNLAGTPLPDGCIVQIIQTPHAVPLPPQASGAPGPGEAPVLTSSGASHSTIGRGAAPASLPGRGLFEDTFVVDLTAGPARVYCRIWDAATFSSARYYGESWIFTVDANTAVIEVPQFLTGFDKTKIVNGQRPQYELSVIVEQQAALASQLRDVNEFANTTAIALGSLKAQVEAIPPDNSLDLQRQIDRIGADANLLKTRVDDLLYRIQKLESVRVAPAPDPAPVPTPSPEPAPTTPPTPAPETAPQRETLASALARLIRNRQR